MKFFLKVGGGNLVDSEKCFLNFESQANSYGLTLVLYREHHVTVHISVVSHFCRPPGSPPNATSTIPSSLVFALATIWFSFLIFSTRS